MKPLFQKINSPIMEKRAYSIKLGKDVNEWPIKVLQEAYKQVPYLRSYEVDVEIDRSDESRGYGVGKMLVYPARMQKNAAIRSDRIISFPLIIRDHELAPFDVVSHKNAMMPATEAFVSGRLFRPEMFERRSKVDEFHSQGIGIQIDPPEQRLRQSTGIGKQASVSLWKAILPTIRQDDAEKFKQELRRDPSLRVAAISNPALGEIVEDLLTHKEKQASEVIVPTVVQFRKSGRKYFMKTANHTCFSPEEAEVSRFEAQDYLADSDFAELLENGHVTYVTTVHNKEASVMTPSIEAERIGIYTTYSGSDKISGIVIPRVVDFDGNSIESKLFIGGDQCSFQEKIAGVYKGTTHIPSTDDLRGKGVFVYQYGDRGFATIPVEITNRVTIPDGTEKRAYYRAKNLVNNQTIKINIIPGLMKVACIGDHDIAIPAAMKFVPLPDRERKVSSDLSGHDEMAFPKTASAIEVVSDGSLFQLRGSTHFPDMIDVAEASFALGCHGLSGRQARNVLEKAASDGHHTVKSTRRIDSLEVAEGRIKRIAQDHLQNLSKLRVNLIKEASVLVDKETVDSILSLRFLTPENVGMYVNYIPELEKVSSKLAEILIASRLGMDEIKEVAAKNAMNQLSSVISGLSSIQSKIM